MKKNVKITLIVLAVIILAIGGFAYSVLGDKTIPALLNVESGNVLVNGNAVQGEVKLSEDDVIATKDGEATVILYDSVVISLDANTEVTISDLNNDYPKVKQVSGSTWTKFADVVGMQNVDVETPTTVATVRGTEFGVDVNGNTSSVMVGEGNVGVGDQNVGEFQKLIRDNNGARFAQLSPEEKQKIIQKMRRTLMRMKEHRNRHVFNNKMGMRMAQGYGVDRARMMQYIDDIDSGRLNDADLIAKSPIQVGAMQKIKRMNDRIKAQQNFIELASQR